jgi:hypothetical protein
MGAKQHTPEEIKVVVRDVHDYLKLAAHWRGLLPRKDGRSGRDLPEKQDELLEMARQGNVDAYDMLRQLAIIELNLLSVQPAKISLTTLSFIFDLFKKYEPSTPRKRGRDANSHLQRDRRIVNAVELVSRCGFKPTRNRASADKEGSPSGCSIVTSVLKRLGIPMTERNVEAIWARRRQIVDKPWKAPEWLWHQQRERRKDID